VTPTPTEAFLEAVTAPLDFLATAAPEAAARTRLPSRQLAARADALCALGRRPRAAPVAPGPWRRVVGFNDAAPAQRREVVARCQALVERVRRPPVALPAVPAPQRPTRRRISPGCGSPCSSPAGWGPRRAEQLRRFGIPTIEDLLYHLPFRYEDRRSLTTVRQLRAGEVASVVGEITHLASVTLAAPSGACWRVCCAMTPD